MVWTSRQGNLQQRPQIYFTFRDRPGQEAGDRTESFLGLSSTNRWPLRAKEPVDRTIPPDRYGATPSGLDHLASTRYSRTQ